MQCPNCGFENIPGLPACARCQSVLDLGGVAVVPHRASALRLTTRVFRIWYRLGGQTTSLVRLLPPWRPAMPAPVPWSALARTIVVPGWGSIREGHRRLGYALLAVWLFGLLAALITLAGPWSIWWLAMAIAAHATAIIALFAGNLAFEGIIVRVLFGALLFLGLQWGLYRPLTRLGQLLVVPLELANLLPGPVLNPGDGILYQGRWLRPAAFARGDLVVYAIHEDGGVGVIIREGLGLDRVIGLPGERVRLQEGVITINGGPLGAGISPLGPLPRLPDFDLVLAPGEYLIIPSRLELMLYQQAHGGVPSAIIQRLMIVPEEHILGRVLCRVRPWRHMGTVK